MKSIACIGMAVADLIVGPVEGFNFTTDVTLVDNVNIKAGGDAANVALNLAALETPVSLHTKLGKDLFGQWLIEHYQGYGIDTRSIHLTTEESTGTAIALVDNNGERVFLYRGGTVDTLSIDDIHVDNVLAHDMLHSSGFYLLPSLEKQGLPQLFKLAYEQGLVTSLDVGWDSTGQWLKTIRPILPYLTYFLPTLNEAREITGKDRIEDCANFLLSQGVSNVVIKAGAEGAYVHDGKRGFMVPGNKVTNVVDTTGAGDGFVSGFLAAISRGLDIKTAVQTGNNAGAAVVQQYGSTGALNNYQQICIEEKEYEKAI